ncbi:hypothetical protein [Haloarchaeobius amylolyticus]|uniref:hypothetical protein n=1 Tax=Haloarchaeobius amylolyticus TaxID=1198296 RepID=UPI00226DE72E|nr:hypothetical protein [Haloarchaeobius amylolyticus]
MTKQHNPRVTRRQVLAGLGTIGVASAGAGLGTTAFYSDRESLEGWLEAGRVDLILDYRTTYKPWERYDLHDVPMDARPAVVAGTGGMTYEIGAAPAVRDENGEAISHEDWGDIQTSLPVCTLPVPTDLTDDRNPDVLGGLTVENDPENQYLPGYVDGQDNGENGPVMFVDLDDIKPYDEGETTFSLHLCGNPSFITASLADMLDLEDSDETENPIEPEVEAGEPEAGDRTDEEMAVWDGGELADYMYVIISVDQDCDNLTANNILTESDVDDIRSELEIDGDFDVLRNNVLYAGSLAGWKQLLAEGVALPPSGAGAAGSPTMENGVDQGQISITEEDDGCHRLGKIEWDDDGGEYDVEEDDDNDAKLTDAAGAVGDQFVITANDDSGAFVSLEVTAVDDTDDPKETTFEILGGNVGICGAVVKGGGGPNTDFETLPEDQDDDQFQVFEYECLETGDEFTVDSSDIIVGNDQQSAISNVQLFYCELFDDEFDPDPEGEPGDCFAPGAHCYVLEWYLPCKENDPDRLGFTDLPVYGAIDQSGALIVEQDDDTDGQEGASRLSFNDELRQRGFVDDEGATIDVNVTQTDSCHMTIEFEAVQCRHNTGGELATQ